MYKELTIKETMELDGGKLSTGLAILGTTVSVIVGVGLIATSAPLIAGGAIIAAAVGLPVGIAESLGGDL